MTLARPLLPLALGLALTASPLAAQQPLLPGTRIRITVPTFDAEREEGTVVDVRADTLVVRFRNSSIHPRVSDLALRDGAYALPVSAIDLLEVNAGPGGHKTIAGLKTGFLVGAAVGVPLGILAYLSGDDTCPPKAWLCLFQFTAGPKALLVGATCLSLGAEIGIIAGALTRDEKWQPVAGWGVSPKLGFSGGRPGIGLSVNF